MENFWGQRTTQSKGMRFNTRLVWHYFTYQETWARGKGMFSACRANWAGNEFHTLAKQIEKPPRKECCADCHSQYNKQQMKLNLQEDISNYVIGTIYALPKTPRSQVEAMVILHYDIPDAKAKELVGLALVKVVEVLRREEKVKANELTQIRGRLDIVIEMTPELSPTKSRNDIV